MIDPVPLRAVERHFFAVHRKEILTEEFTEGREQIAEPSDHRIVSPDRVLGLGPVQNEQDNRRGRRQSDYQQKQQRQVFKRGSDKAHYIFPWRDVSHVRSRPD